jgi:hypothetical protein
MSKNTSRTKQSESFIRKARELGCDEDPEAFERVFARVVPPKRRPVAGKSPEPVPHNKHAKRTATKRRLKEKPPADQN